MKPYRVYPSGNSAAPWAIDEGTIYGQILVQGVAFNDVTVLSSVRVVPPPTIYIYTPGDPPDQGPDAWFSVSTAAMDINNGFVTFGVGGQ